MLLLFLFFFRRAHARKFLQQGAVHFTCASSTLQQGDVCEGSEGIWSTVLVDTTVDDYMLSLNAEKGYAQSSIHISRVSHKHLYLASLGAFLTYSSVFFKEKYRYKYSSHCNNFERLQVALNTFIKMRFLFFQGKEVLFQYTSLQPDKWSWTITRLSDGKVL